MTQADFIVVGAGHNSLITAAYLTQAGQRVHVLEGHARIGGDTITEELTLPGFHHDSCSSAHVLIQSNPLLRNNELGLDRYGLEYLFPDPVVVIPFPDGESITMYRDPERTAAEFGRYSRRDARAYVLPADQPDGARDVAATAGQAGDCLISRPLSIPRRFRDPAGQFPG